MHALLVILLGVIGQTYCVSELFHNNDFESSNFAGNWICSGCTLTLSNDHKTGRHSGMVTHRQASWAGLGYDVTLTPGKRYVMKGYIKLLNKVAGVPYHTIQVMLSATDSNGHKHYITLSEQTQVQTSFGWNEIGGDYTIPQGLHQIRIYLQIHEKEVNYLVDGMSFKELQTDNNWKSAANARIENIRKADVNVRVQNPHGISTSHLQLELQQTKSKFAFGTAINAEAIVDNNQKAYQNFFYDNFEWAVLENALKWRLMEWTEGHPNFDRPMRAINAMLSKGIKIRGHNMFWAVQGHSPKWLDSKDRQHLLQAMHTHVNEMLTYTRGKLEHWDVNNENIHGDYFEKHTGNPNITQEMFKWIHAEEPAVKLFLNDFNTVNEHYSTTPYKEQARRFKESSVPIYGVGVQSHFRNSNLDMTAVEYRLNQIAEVGLPIWITELTVADENTAAKADALENAMTLYFSNPLVEGILLWGFSDQHVYSHDIALTHGSSMTPNAAGRRYQELFKQRWRTHETVHLQNQHVCGFKGDYILKIKANEHVIGTKTFTLDSPKTVSVHLSGTDSNPHAQMTVS